MLGSARIDSKRKMLTIQLPLQKATPSKSSGKTLVVATTHGCQVTEARHSGRPIVIAANAFIYPANRPQKGSSKVERRPKAAQVAAPAIDAATSYRGKEHP